MKCKDVSKYLPDFLADELEKGKRVKVNQHLSECSSCCKEVEELRTLWAALGKLPEEKPSENMRARFDAMLDAYTAGQPKEQTPGFRERMTGFLDGFWPKSPEIQFGLALAMLIAGLFFGYKIAPSVQQPPSDDVTELRTELHDLRQMVATALLRNDSATDRLRGVSFSYAVSQPADEVLSALLNTLNYDANLNVRLATIDALSAFYEEAGVRKGLIDALGRQTSPLVQIALIDVLAQMKEKQSIQTLEVLQKNEMFNQTVRMRAGKAIEQIR